MPDLDQTFSPGTACDLRQVQRFTEAALDASEVASATISDLHDVVTAYLVELESNPAASPHDVLTMAGEARARVASLIRAVDGAFAHLGQLPIRVLGKDGQSAEGEATAGEPLPEDPRPKEARHV